MHLNVGTFAVANQYRSPTADDEDLTSLNDELEDLSQQTLGNLIAGDLNIHHRRWLIHSNVNTAQGELLFRMMCRFQSSTICAATYSKSVFVGFMLI